MTNIFMTVGIIALIVFIALTFFILQHLSVQKKSEKLLSDFYAVISQFNFIVSKQEVIGERIISIDDVNNRLLFFTNMEGSHQGYMIELDDIKNITLKREYHRKYPDLEYVAGIAPSIRKVDLQLHYENKNRPSILNFYRKGIDGGKHLKEYTSKAIEWQQLIAARLGKNFPVTTGKISQLRQEAVASE
jgi:hypothetical protein